MNFDKRVEHYIMDLIAIMIITIVGFYHWQDMDVLAVFGDEFGYWGNSAILAGYDWKPLMAETAYYSIGYSLLLLPIILVKNHIIKYHLAIILNILLTIGSYFCARYIATYLFGKETKIKQVCSSLVSVLSVNVIVQMRVAWDETLLCFLMWLSIVLMISIHKSHKMTKIIMTSFTLIYMIMTHQRAIPVVLLFILIILVRYKSKADWKKAVSFLLISAILYLTYKYIKSFQIANIYSNSTKSSVNNYTITGDLVSRYLYIVFSNCLVMIISFWAKFIIYNISTGFTFLITSVSVAKTFFIKTGAETGKNNVIRYIWLSGVTMLCLTAIQMHGAGRADLIVYTRYFDFTIGPMILVGIKCLNEKKVSCKVCLLLSLAISWLSVGKIYDFIYSAENGFNYVCSPIMAGNIVWFDEHMENLSTIKALTSKVILTIGLLFFMYIRNKSDKLLVGIAISTLTLSIILANHASDPINKWRKYFREDTVALAAGLEIPDAEIYFIAEEDKDNYLNLMRELQFVLCTKKITMIDEEQLLNITDNVYYIITADEYDEKDFELIVSTKTHKVNLYYVKER